ncbi:sodium channel and clathrin linker 1-like [Lagopus leucura]|uniref:sodium channel and clathrin linker 1-like n=1 Tax=Lagopus leucura TaxID=30410 RepID=UPI001C66F210|nr:sodium channel and clathrin linker 1-like [Lagopus leucura]
MIRLTKTLPSQMERKEEDVVSAQQREAASDKLLQQLQSSIKQLETRLHVSVQDGEQMRTERTALEKQIRMLHTKCANLEREKYEAVARVQDCVQLLEEANLQKSQALFKKKQKEEEIKKMKDEVFQITEDTAARTRKAVSDDV